MLEFALLYSITSMGVILLIHKGPWISSPEFLTSFLCLFLYIIPLYTLPWSVDSAVYPVVGLGVVGLITGVFLGGKGKCFKELIGSYDFNIIKFNFCLKMLALGLLLYSVLFVTRGVPIFSNAIDLARVNFLQGSGYISMPATVLIILSLVFIYCIKGGYIWLCFFVPSMIFLLASGWRGYLIFGFVPVFVTAVILKRIKFYHYVLMFFSIIFVAILGIERSISGGAAIYGIDLRGQGYIFGALNYINFRMGEHFVGLQNIIHHFNGYHLYGAGALMDISPFFPFFDETLGKYMARLYASWTEGGAMTITMLGGFYADFGIIGLLPLGMIAGYFYSFVYYKFLEMDRFGVAGPAFSGVLSTAWLLSFMGTFFTQFITFFIFYLIVFIFATSLSRYWDKS